MIASSPDVAYIHEPFNLRPDPGVCKAQFYYWFTYISEQNENDFYQDIKNTIEFRTDLLSNLKHARSSKERMHEIGRFFQLLKYRASNVRPLLKDPIAVFSADWLSSKFNADNIIMIRHPLAFAGSIKVNNWKHPFSHFLAQPLLMNDHLYPFAEEIKYFAKEDRDIIDQAVLLWKLIHYMILKYKKSKPAWIYIRHEDLSGDPVKGFKSIFSKLNIEYSKHVSEVITSHSMPVNSEALRYSDFKELQRDSASNIRNWEDRLTPAEVKRIKSQVYEISKEFYSDDEW
jgi:hypothetical protein